MGLAKRFGASRSLILGLVVGALIVIFYGHTGSAPAQTADQLTLEELDRRLRDLELLLQNLEGNEEGDLFLVKANLYIQSGYGATDAPVNGTGNLIIGYNENSGDDDRDGSHNLIIGRFHSYTSYAGLVTGRNNAILNINCIASGLNNTASGQFASVSGGENNEASGFASSISGGIANTASAPSSSVLGGIHNIAERGSSCVSGGGFNIASGEASSVSGGLNNRAIGSGSSVSGGGSFLAIGGNQAIGDLSSVSGGQLNNASDFVSSVSGGVNNDADDNFSSIAGGVGNVTEGVGDCECFNITFEQMDTDSNGQIDLADLIIGWATRPHGDD